MKSTLSSFLSERIFLEPCFPGKDAMVFMCFHPGFSDFSAPFMVLMGARA